LVFVILGLKKGNEEIRVENTLRAILRNRFDPCGMLCQVEPNLIVREHIVAASLYSTSNSDCL
jgi:hypothetical protein